MTRPGLLDEPHRRALAVFAAVGAAAFLIAAKTAPERAWHALLLAGFYFAALSACALVFVAVQHLTAAGWSTLLRRVPEALARSLWVGTALLVVAALGAGHLYHWAHPGGHDAVLHAKAGYLNLPFWAARGVVSLGLWTLFAALITGNSRAQDASGAVALTARNRRLSAVFLVVFGLTFTLSCVDWLMSLEPHWYSTLYAWYVFSGSFVGAVAATTALVVLLRRRGFFEGLGAAHLHDLGKYLFAFSVFWAYLWFSQFLLIWYSNIPEETVYYASRGSRGWFILQALNLLVNFAAPFVLLLRAQAKRRTGALLATALLLCAGRWLDFYIMVMPSAGGGARPHWCDLPVFLGAAALFVLAFDRAFRSAAPVPERDPYLGESLAHHG